MNRAGALLCLAAMLGLAVLGLYAPWPVLLVPALLPLGIRRGRVAYTVMAGLGIVLQTALFALLLRQGPLAHIGPLTVSPQAAAHGAIAGLRLAAILGGNLALLAIVPAARILEGLRFGPAATGFLAAILLAAQGLAEDARRLQQARSLAGRWPERRLARLAATASLLPPLMALSLERAQARREALRMAGHGLAAGMVPVIAVAALGVAGRMPFVGLPNIALTYVVVFCAGMLWGARVAALGGLLAMVLTDFILSGLLPSGLVNAPAMALLGCLGALFRPRHFIDPARSGESRVLAAAVGFLAVMVFSVAADTLDWALVPELRHTPGALALRIGTGLAFNIIPASANAVIFAFAVTPVARAGDALRARAG